MKYTEYFHIDDFKKGTICYTCSGTPEKDALLVLKIAQFASRFNFNISIKMKEIMKSVDLSVLPKENVYREMKQALMFSDKPSVFFEILREVHQLSYWFPELKATIGSQQSEKYHPEGDVWQHTMCTIDMMAKLRDKAKYSEYLMVSALCHDFGKPLALSFDDEGTPHNFKHEKLGVPVALEFVHRISDDKRLCAYVENMVRYHMTPHRNYTNLSKIKTTNRTFDASICPDDLILLIKADSSSTGNIKYAEKENAFLIERFAEYKELMDKPQVTGKDLIALGLPPSPKFKDILDKTHKLHLSGVDKDSVLKGIMKGILHSKV